MTGSAQFVINRQRHREPEATEQDDGPEFDDEPELDDYGGGNVEDEGEPENGILHPGYGIDKSTGPSSPCAL